METGDWGADKRRIWGLEPYYDPGRAIQIHEAIKGLKIKTVIDMACGVGIVAESLAWVIPGHFTQFDIEEYPEWEFLKIKPTKADLFQFIKEDTKFDLVLMLNSYRNWDEEPRKEFNGWLKRNAKYFITSYEGENPVCDNWSVIGKDVKGHSLKLYTL
jgi:hypothetical protein